MPSSPERDALRALLAAVDARAPDLVERLAGRPREGDLFGVLARHELDDLEVALLLVALASRLDGRGFPSGGELARGAVPDSARRLEALNRLEGRARLVSAGFLVPESAPAHAALTPTIRYRLGEHVFRLACQAAGRPPVPEQPAPTGPYRNNAELLADLRRLSLHYRRRAASIFHLDPWTGTGIEVLDDTTALVRRARLETQRVARRLRQTDPTSLPMLALRERHNLDLDGLVILTTVLFQELVEGVGSVDAVDLVKLVSENEADLIRRRTLLRPLARKGLLRLEGAYASKELTADASLPDGVVNAMLASGEGIDPDERIDFHAYLEKLGSSDTFFRDMDG